MGQVTYLVLQPIPSGFSPTLTEKAALERCSDIIMSQIMES